VTMRPESRPGYTGDRSPTGKKCPSPTRFAPAPKAQGPPRNTPERRYHRLEAGAEFKIFFPGRGKKVFPWFAHRRRACAVSFPGPTKRLRLVGCHEKRHRIVRLRHIPRVGKARPKAGESPASPAGSAFPPVGQTGSPRIAGVRPRPPRSRPSFETPFPPRIITGLNCAPAAPQ